MDRGTELTVILPVTGDKPRDILRVRRVRGALASEPGDVPFYLLVEDTLITFPEEGVTLNEDLLSRLRDLAGEENVVVKKS